MSNLEKPLSRGEIVHPDADWDALEAELAGCVGHEQKMKFFSTRLAGGGIVGFVLKDPGTVALVKEAQELIDAIIDNPANRHKTGEQLGLLGVSEMICSSPQVRPGEQQRLDPCGP